MKTITAATVRNFGLALCFAGFAPQLPTGGIFVAGSVVDDQSDRVLNNVRVVVWDKQKSRVLSESSTDSAGRFQIDQLPPAQSYLLKMSRQNYVETVVLLPPPRQEAPGKPPVFRLIRHGVITGRLLDLDGRPLKNARIYALKADSPTSYTEPLGLSETDGSGRYRLYGLAPGEYVVGAVGIVDRGEPLLGLLTSPSRGAGRTIAVFGEEHDFDLWLPPNARVDIQGAVRRSGAPGGRLNIGLLDTRYPAVPIVIQQARPDGGFRFENVLPGTYDVIAWGLKQGSNELEFGRARVEAASVGIQGVDIDLRPGARASLDIGTAIPAGCQGPVTMSLTPAEAFPVARTLTASASTGPVTFAPLAPTVYRAEARSDGCESLPAQIDARIRNEFSVLPMTLAGPASIQGRIEVSGEPRLHGVVLVPYSAAKDTSIVVHYLDAQERTFFIDNLPSGRYYALTRRFDQLDQSWKPRVEESMNRIDLIPGKRSELQLQGP